MSRRAFKPTAEQRGCVETMIGYGVPEAEICLLIKNPETDKPIDLETLRKHFAAEIATGAAKMKLLTNGRMLWSRIIGSTVCGELVDSTLFYTIAFYGLWDTHRLIQVLFTQYLLKSAWEIIATPVTYRIVHFLKRTEQEDYFDRHTNFTPFSLRN